MKNKALLVCSSPLFPTNSGDKIYSLNQLKSLAIKYDVIFVNVVTEKYDEELNREQLAIICFKVYIFNDIYLNQGLTAIKSFFSKKPSIVTRSKNLNQINSALKDIIQKEKPDLAVIDHLRSSIYLNPTSIKTYLVEHNDEVRIFKQNYKVSSNPVVKGTYYFLHKFLKKYRDRYYQAVEKVIFISSFDYSDDFKNTRILKNLMIRFEHKKYQIPNLNAPKKNILFCGSMHWHPNLTGIRWFLDNVFDELQENINVLIVGRHLPDSLRKYESDRIQMFSDVPSMEEFFLKSDIFFVPIRTGGGINIKILEALSYGIPIVSTEFSVRGYEGLDFLEPTNDAGEFASRINLLINDPIQMEAMKNRELDYYQKYIEDGEKDFLNLLETQNLPTEFQ